MASDYPLLVSSNFFLTINKAFFGLGKSFEIIFPEAREILCN
jgi:hypothetical protein